MLFGTPPLPPPAEFWISSAAAAWKEPANKQLARAINVLIIKVLMQCLLEVLGSLLCRNHDDSLASARAAVSWVRIRMTLPTSSALLYFKHNSLTSRTFRANRST